MMPNLFLIGFPKCGTTTVYDILKQHPEIYMSERKKPDFFMFESYREALNDVGLDEDERTLINSRLANPVPHQKSDLGEYLQLFPEGLSRKYFGEASHYSNFPMIPEAMARHVQSPRILAMVREPAARLFSMYQNNIRNGAVNYTFTEYIQTCYSMEQQHIAWRYNIRSPLSVGNYENALLPYIRCFGREAVGVFVYEDLKDDFFQLASQIYKWLDVDPGFRPNYVHRSRGGAFVSSRRKQLANFLLGSQMSKTVRKFFPRGIRRRVREVVYSISRKEPEIPVALLDQLKGTIYSDGRGALERLLSLSIKTW